MEIITGGTPFIYVPLKTYEVADPTTLDVDMALVQPGTTPGDTDWQAAAWLAPSPGAGKEIAAQRDPDIWPDGAYTCFVRVHAPPAQLVPLRAGGVVIGPAL